MTVYRVTYHGPTNTLGSRFTVTNLQTGERTTVPYDYSASNAHESAAQSAAGSPVTYGGEDARSWYYVSVSQ